MIPSQDYILLTKKMSINTKSLEVFIAILTFMLGFSYIVLQSPIPYYMMVLSTSGDVTPAYLIMGVGVLGIIGVIRNSVVRVFANFCYGLVWSVFLYVGYQSEIREYLVYTNYLSAAICIASPVMVWDAIATLRPERSSTKKELVCWYNQASKWGNDRRKGDRRKNAA